MLLFFPWVPLTSRCTIWQKIQKIQLASLMGNASYSNLAKERFYLITEIKVMDFNRTWEVSNQILLMISTSINLYEFKFWENTVIEDFHTKNKKFAQCNRILVVQSFSNRNNSEMGRRSKHVILKIIDICKNQSSTYIYKENTQTNHVHAYLKSETQNETNTKIKVKFKTKKILFWRQTGNKTENRQIFNPGRIKSKIHQKINIQLSKKGIMFN